jgi:hypothetical protein
VCARKRLDQLTQEQVSHKRPPKAALIHRYSAADAVYYGAALNGGQNETEGLGTIRR